MLKYQTKIGRVNISPHSKKPKREKSKYLYNILCIAAGKEAESVCEHGVRRIFGTRRNEMTGDWRRLHNEELNDLYCSPNIVR